MTAQSSEAGAEDRWLTLGQASRLLGVHRSTLRRWADDGRVRCQRTAGGHRRFDRRQIEAHRRAATTGERPGETDRADAPQAPAWQSQLQESDQIAPLREMGQRLSGIVIQFLARDDADERLLREAHALGSAYARRSRLAGMSVAEAVEAFLFYRRNLLRLLRHEADPREDPSTRFERYDQVVSAVLIGLVRGYADPD